MIYELRYYSGAGNTELFSKILEHQLIARGHHVLRSRLKNHSFNVHSEDFRTLGLGFPVHFRQAPRLVYEFLRTLDGRGKGIFIFSTKGLYSGNAVRNVSAFAESRGFTLRGSLEVMMPGTDGLILYARKGSLMERSLKAMRSRRISVRMARFVSSLESGSTQGIPSVNWYTGLDESVVKPLEIRFNNRFQDWIDQFHCMNDRCTRCGVCVRGCPRENIRLIKDGVEFGLDCDVCFRCIHRCPAEAIQIGDRTLHTVRYQPERDLPRGEQTLVPREE